jgi:hypothetical protein
MQPISALLMHAIQVQGLLFVGTSLATNAFDAKLCLLASRSYSVRLGTTTIFTFNFLVVFFVSSQGLSAESVNTCLA